MKFKIIVCGLIIVHLMIGCSGKSKDPGREYILNNLLLDERDRGFAIRLFDFLISDKGEQVREDASSEGLKADFLETDDYKKWGFGKVADFTEQERLYTIVMSQGGIEYWEMYKNLDMDKIEDDDKNCLKELHLKYGDGPIDARQILSNDFSAYFAELLCGSRYLDDASIVVIRHILSGIEAYP